MILKNQELTGSSHSLQEYHSNKWKAVQTMGKHILFLIHGIGTHGTNWGEELAGPIKTLKEVSKQYRYFQHPNRDPFADRVGVR